MSTTEDEAAPPNGRAEGEPKKLPAKARLRRIDEILKPFRVTDGRHFRLDQCQIALDAIIPLRGSLLPANLHSRSELVLRPGVVDAAERHQSTPFASLMIDALSSPHATRMRPPAGPPGCQLPIV